MKYSTPPAARLGRIRTRRPARVALVLMVAAVLAVGMLATSVRASWDDLRDWLRRGPAVHGAVVLDGSPTADGLLHLRPVDGPADAELVVAVRDGEWTGYLPPWRRRAPERYEVVRARFHGERAVPFDASIVERGADDRFVVRLMAPGTFDFEVVSTDPEHFVDELEVFLAPRASTQFVDSFHDLSPRSVEGFPRPDFAYLEPLAVQRESSRRASVTIPATRDLDESVLWVGAPGFAWRRLNWNESSLARVVVELQPGARLDLDLEGRPADASVLVRLHRYDYERGALRHEDRVVRGDEPASFDRLPPGNYWVGAGVWGNRTFLVDEPAIVGAGDRVIVRGAWREPTPADALRYEQYLRWGRVEREPANARSPRSSGLSGGTGDGFVLRLPDARKPSLGIHERDVWGCWVDAVRCLDETGRPVNLSAGWSLPDAAVEPVDVFLSTWDLGDHATLLFEPLEPDAWFAPRYFEWGDDADRRIFSARRSEVTLVPVD